MHRQMPRQLLARAPCSCRPLTAPYWPGGHPSMTIIIRYAQPFRYTADPIHSPFGTHLGCNPHSAGHPSSASVGDVVCSTLHDGADCSAATVGTLQSSISAANQLSWSGSADAAVPIHRDSAASGRLALLDEATARSLDIATAADTAERPAATTAAQRCQRLEERRAK